MYKEVRILIAEDDDGHAELIQEGLIESGVTNPILRFSNGEEAWDYLCSFQPTEYALLLLLDINMPRMDGIEVLRRIKSHESLKETLVIMLTTTDDPREIDTCYQLGCNVYITKPVDFKKLTETLHRLGLFIQIIKI